LLVHAGINGAPTAQQIERKARAGFAPAKPNFSTAGGWTDWRLCWRIAKLWEIPAEELLAASDAGLIPWVPLTQFLSGQAVGASAEARLGEGSS